MKRQLLVSPTGSGKTVLFVFVAKNAVAKGKRVLVLTHRNEILDQICRTLREWDQPHETLVAGAKMPRDYSILVASVGTLSRRLGKGPRPDLIVVDEAHHSAAGTWVKIFAEYTDAMWLGVTATPERLDGRGLGDFYDRMIMGPDVQTLIDQGFLARPRYFAAPRSVDVSNIRRTAGDFNKADLSKVIDVKSVIGDAVVEYRKHCLGRTAIVFCISLIHAEHVCAAFNAAGIASEIIEGKMGPDQRRSILSRLRSRETMVLVSVDLISEGFDLPAVGAAISLRPTESLALHLQQIGRALRPADGKTDAIILDHAGNLERHGFAEEPREWTLEGYAKRKAKPKPTRRCENCFCVFPPPPPCPECGWVPDRRDSNGHEGVQFLDGFLTEVDAKKAMEAKAKRAKAARVAFALSLCDEYDDFRKLAREFGYAEGWAWFQYRRHRDRKRSEHEHRITDSIRNPSLPWESEACPTVQKPGW